MMKKDSLCDPGRMSLNRAHEEGRLPGNTAKKKKVEEESNNISKKKLREGEARETKGESNKLCVSVQLTQSHRKPPKCNNPLLVSNCQDRNLLLRFK
jgi:hypothetical protein